MNNFLYQVHNYIGMYLVQEVVHTNGMHASWDVDHTF